MHEYNLTPHSLYAAVSVGLETETIIAVLNKLSKTKLPKDMIEFIYNSTANYGKVKLVLKKNKYLVESPFTEVNPDLEVELKPTRNHGLIKKKSLSKMFGNGRARSGIIVLPCGAGKSLVGVSAASKIRKSCLCLATNAVSFDLWAFQFKLWSTITEEQICRFTSDSNERFRGNAGVVVTTYNMIAFNGKRSDTRRNKKPGMGIASHG